jgi:hypothetical protein
MSFAKALVDNKQQPVKRNLIEFFCNLCLSGILLLCGGHVQDHSQLKGKNYLNFYLEQKKILNGIFMGVKGGECNKKQVIIFSQG